MIRFYVQKNFTILSLLYIGFLVVLSSCSATKYVPKGAYLLQKNQLFIDGDTHADLELKKMIVQRPNQKILGLPFLLYFYNIGNKDYEALYQKWLLNKPKTYRFLETVFSEKQAVRAGLVYKSFNNWFLQRGEAPVVLDDNKSRLSLEKLRTYYFNQGYFDAEVDYAVDLKLKKVAVSYNIIKNKPYYLDSIVTMIDSKVIDSIYQATIATSFLNKNDRYKNENFRKESKRLTNIFRNSGIYHFSENQIGFYEIDTTAKNHKTPVLLKITDRLSEKNGEIQKHPLKIQKIAKIDVFTDYSYDRKEDLFKDTVNYKNYTFYSHDKLKYSPKFLVNAIFIEPGQIYKDSTRNLTQKYLQRLKNFKRVKIRYSEMNEDELVASIFLTPLKKYTIGIDTEAIHSNIKQLGFSGGLSFLNRNTFKGAELFKVSFQGTVFDVSKKMGSNDKPFSSWELTTEASLEIPRFILPFKVSKITDKSKKPKTLFSIGSSFQKNIGLDKQKFTGILDYSWKSNKKTTHNIELINAQYVKNLNKNSYFKIYASEYNDLRKVQQDFFPEDLLTTTNALDFINEHSNDNFKSSHPDEYQILKNIANRNEILTTDFVIPSFSYSIIYNNQLDFKDNDYFFFRANVLTAGNLATAVSKKYYNNVKTFKEIPIAQFVKMDLEFKRFWETSFSSVLVYRSFLGIAIPYGNSSEIPFSKSYFIGGSNDIRAWRSYELGPGASNTGLEFNIGNLKFISNLEYRFKISKSINTALFLDAGNIWGISSSKLTKNDGQFSELASLKNIALGAGFGLRYDFNFFILRMDLGFKTYEPYLEEKKWFQHFNFQNSVLNIGINYPF